MPVIQQLIETVEDLLKEHENLLALEEHKKQVLIAGDIAALQEITTQEARFIRRVEQLEEQRVRIGQQVAAKSGLALEDLTASKLAELVTDPQKAAKINLLTGRFAKVIGELRAANEVNGQLLKQSLELVQHSIEMMTDAPDAGTYSSKRDMGQVTGTRRFFDTQA